MNGSMVSDVPKLACQALEEEERKKETVLAEKGNFENAISPEPSGISTRSKRPEVRLVLIFPYKKAFERGTIHGAAIFTGKPGL